jgi:hypothetical protein
MEKVQLWLGVLLLIWTEIHTQVFKHDDHP